MTALAPIPAASHSSVSRSIADLPFFDVAVSDKTPGDRLNGEFKKNAKLPGILVLHDGELVGTISRSSYYQVLSGRMGQEIYGVRPVERMLKHINLPPFVVAPDASVAEVVRKGLERPLHVSYDPVVYRHPVAGYRIVDFHELMQAQSELLGMAMVEVEEKNKQVHDSILYAERIQRSMLYNPDRPLPIHLEHFVVFRPRDIVSGDFYWIREANDRIYVAVADCTGHGVPGAFMSLIGHGHLNDIVSQRGYTDPGIILEELHKGVRDSLCQETGNDSAHDGMEVGLCVVNPASGELLFAGANRPLYSVDAAGQFHEHKGDRKPIGGTQKEAKREFATLSLRIEDGTTYYLCSDGVGDQPNPEGKKLGSRRVREALYQLASRSLGEQKAAFEKVLDDHQAGAPQRDDIALLGFHLKGSRK
ncbi:MAG: SpoIIE family protein phosphatase [Verrucomicrobium sp.]|nr:SpoIIE family protein phosphatase [Verrucomicrobium sp.]